MNSVIESLMNHRSIRRFSDRKIEPEVLETILTAGTRAATAGNLQYYTFLVIDDPDRLEALNNGLIAPFIASSNCSLAILALADQYRIRRWLRMHSDRDIVSNRSYSLFIALWDALIALQNVVVAAESMGLGTCYIGSGIEADVEQLFGVPEYVFPAGLVCLGYPKGESKLSMRLPLEAVVHRNEYHLASDDEISLWYSERDRVWDTLSEERRERLVEQGISGIAQAVAAQKFSPELIDKRSRRISENLRKSRFDLG